ncbi:hypothetical protein EC957_008381 [Mortierella hygrophila]|uniref:RING-type domain-containing protein n=1 Tax=Mortierella hygrophila TaxID=979708 RepID=A0A9P6JXM8_9FUNG|nr:hypothetical protein EC957_008381 [Mortierella hygrophila]
MNVNATSFSPQGTGNDKPSGNSNFRSNLSSSLANDIKKSNQRTPAPSNQSKSFPAEQQQRSLPGRGKNQRQSNSKRSGHDREPQPRSGGGGTAGGAGPNVRASSSWGSDSLAVSMSQLSTSDKSGGAGRGNNKKNQVSLNHLLNFSFPVREEPQNTAPVRRRRNANYQPFNKEKFINANFRFLMNPRSDYAVYTMDADAPVQWDDIEQVLIAVPQSCPICLQPPVAARITKCGHVYCLSCVLRYLSLNESNKAWRKCPICWDAIYEKDLRSVRSALEDQQIYDQGEKEIAKLIASKQDVQLEMRLIQRTLNSTVALPRSHTFPLAKDVLTEELQGQPPLDFVPDAILFSRLMITTLDRIVSELDRDIRSIEFSIQEARSFDANHHSEEMVFFEMAMSKIQEKKDKIRDDAKFLPKLALDRERILRRHFDHAASEVLAAASATAENEESATPGRPALSFAESGPEAYEIGHGAPNKASVAEESDADHGSELGPDMNAPQEAALKHHASGRVPNQLTTMYYFYQASNGHHLYLQPLDIRILKQHFETYDKFPDTITVKVLGIEETSLTEEVRKKCKYLGHLPLGCEVSFLDVALETIVGDEGVKPFETELRMRRAKRKEKDVREERERVEREHKLNPPKARRNEELFVNDPFFHVPIGAGGGSQANRRDSEADLQEALRLSAQAQAEEMPTLSEAHARSTRRPSIPTAPGTATRTIPTNSRAANQSLAGATGPLSDAWGSSYESNGSSQATGPSTVWGTPSVPVSRNHDEYDDYYEDEMDYEPDIVVKRGKKKLTVLMSNNSRRSR